MEENRPIRVLQVIRLMNHGGAESMIMNLYRNIDRSKVQFDFVQNSFEPAFYDAEIKAFGGRVYRCFPYNGKNYREYRQWWIDFLTEHRDDYRIVHGHNGNMAAIYLKAAKQLGFYTIAHSHNTNPKGIRNLLYKAYSFRIRFIADFCFACSYQAGADRFGKRIMRDKTKSRIIKNAIDTAAYRFNDESRRLTRDSLGFSNQDIVIGNVGRLVEQKNHSFLLDVFAKICTQEPKARLLLVGDGDLRQTLEDKANKLGIAGKTVFTGTRNDIPELINAMDVFVFTSLWEGFGISIIEAQASGLPCVISDRVPGDCMITKNLISVMSLKETPGEWAKHILSRKYEHSGEVAAAGFDIAETAKWLEEFYIEHSKQ